VPFLGAAEWHAAIRHFFAKPDEFVLGRVSARAAGERFARAVVAVLDRHPTGAVVVVAHGTVISLFVARFNAVEPLSLWERLGVPWFVVVSLPGCGMTDIVPNVRSVA
jgi:broad specificity phosphatase PhoE